MNLAQAQSLAERILVTMQPYVERAAIAGSIRRCKPEVKDIEIVAIPKPGQPTDLFQLKPENLLYRWAQQMEAEDKIWWIKTGVDAVIRWPIDQHGKYWRGFLVKAEVKLDLFLTTPETWGITFLTRTGPKEYSARLADQCRPAHYFAEGKLIDREGKFVPTLEEQDVFDALGLPFARPERRQ